MTRERPPTPPHHPTHNVHLSLDVIREIAAITSPGATVKQIEQLPPGLSFNNRIYFLSLQQNVFEDDSKEVAPTEQVLKVAGHFFRPDKIQNEVSCLLLLERYCPEIPCPRIIAYSEDGHIIRRIQRSQHDGKPWGLSQSAHPLQRPPVPRFWILTTRCPGRLLEKSDFSKAFGKDIMKELANYMRHWRLDMPKVSTIGNLNFPAAVIPEKTTNTLETSPGLPEISVSGLVLETSTPTTLISTSLEYYQIKLQSQLTVLETEDVFASNRSELAPMVRRLMQNTLPRLSLFSTVDSVEPTFTHYDFSPRNILVTNADGDMDQSSPRRRITGILDFEFAGFFPPEEEFTNTAVNSEGDWPEDVYDYFLACLEGHGVKTPRRRMDATRWQQALALVKITADVAPWKLRAGGTDGDDLLRELQGAAERVVGGIRWLEQCVES